MYILSVHIPIAGMSLIPVLFKWPLALFPVHIVFLELIIDPACSVVFEAESAEKDIMKRKPRNLTDPLFGKSAVITSLIQGLLIMSIIAGVYAFVMKSHGENTARALAFMTLVISNVGLIFANRSHSKSILKSLLQPNPALWWVTGGTCALLAMALTIPFFHKLFRFDYFEIDDLFLCIGAGIFSIICVEILKLKMFKSKE
jgi:Ca2+-transporting ATPase